MADFTIAPIGTCRIHTPLRNAVTRYPFKLQLGRNYGFVHTSTEALQQARFMFGECDIPADVQRLIFRPSVMGKARSATHTPADLYLVELSSRKLLTLDGHPIQSNYLTRHFTEFFADRARARTYWSLASTESLAERRALLDQDPVFKSLPAEDRELLARIVKRDLSDDEIEAEMGQIVTLLGKDKVVFVTHVNALAAGNTPIESRQELIRVVTQAAERLGVPSYDPTAVMNKFGQADAMENGGLDLTHYTERFSDRLGAEWFKTYMRPKMSASLPTPAAAKLGAEESVERIEKVWESGDVREASRRVRDVLRRHPGLPDHTVLLARMQSELGAYEEAISLLENAGAVVATGSKAEQILMRSHFKLGRYDLAYSLSAGLIGDEKETPEILRVAAASAAQLGYLDEALSNWKLAFRTSSASDAWATEAADTVLSILQASGDMEAVLRWVSEVREKQPSNGRSFAVLWRDRLIAGDRASLRDLASESPVLTDAEAFELVQEATWRGCLVAAAALTVSSGMAKSEQEDIRAWLQAQSASWATEGAQALEEGRLRDAAERICAHRMLDPDTLASTRALRAFERATRLAVRAALLAGNHKEVIELTDIALDAHVDFPELDAMRGRAADALGDTKTAMRHLERAVAGEAAQFSTKLYYARVAFNGGWFGEAIDAYKAVLNHASADQNAKDEAERQLGRLGPRSIRAARQMLAEGDPQAAWSLLDRVEQSWPQMPEVAHEKRRILGVLYAEVRALAPSSTHDRLAVGEKILALVHDDVIGLRTAAVGAMRLHMFEKALPYWQLLKARSENPEQFDNYIHRCQVWIDKANRRRAA
ncbi:putative capsular polysaccharide biosynthesis protein [plant metagenome]|uniref:Putative capsular polysaccharide biosynthesis protein n=1 Tax=plant metagenome TaxID=1297885 RepID=A0A484SV40_9ZZZZ